MKKQTYFSGPAEYDQKRPYCVVTPSGPNVAYDIHSRHATRAAAQAACERGSVYNSVMTITEVKKADTHANDTESARLLASFAND